MTLVIQSNSRRYIFDSLANLRLLSGQKLQDNEIVDLSGHTSAGDQGGGDFYWDSSSTATDDNGTIIKLADTTTGRFIRTDQSVLTPEMFGAVGDGVTNDGDAMRAIHAVGGRISYTSGKTYLVDQDGANTWCVRNVLDDLDLRAYGATLKCTDGELQILRSDGGDNFSLLGLTVEGLGTDGSDLGAGIIQINNGTGITVADTTSINSDQDGIAISTCVDVSVQNHTSINDSKSGIYPNDCTNVRIENCTVRDFGGHLVSSSPVGLGIQSSGNTNIVIDGNVINTGTGTGIRVNDTATNQPQNSIVSNNVVIDCTNPTNTAESFGIRITNGHATKATGTVVTGNYCRGNALYNLYLENHSGAVVENNELIESLREGMIIATIIDAVVQNNTFINTNTDVANQNKYDINLINAADGVELQGNTYITSASFATNYSTAGITDGSSGANPQYYKRDYDVTNHSVVWQPNSGSSIADDALVSTTITSTGASFGDYCLVSAPYNANDCILTAYVQTSGTIKIDLYNASGAGRTFASGTWNVRVLKV